MTEHRAPARRRVNRCAALAQSRAVARRRRGGDRSIVSTPQLILWQIASAEPISCNLRSTLVVEPTVIYAAAPAVDSSRSSSRACRPLVGRSKPKMSERTANAHRVRFDPTRARGADIYQRASRHSRRVSVLKLALPVAAIVAVGGFFFTMRFADFTGRGTVAVKGLNIDTKSLIMEAPHLSGFDSSKRPYRVNASTAVQDLANPQLVHLETIDAHFATDDTNTAVLKSRSGLLDNAKNKLRLRNGITIVTTNGYHVTMIDADIDIAAGKLVSLKPVEIHSTGGDWLKASGVYIENKGAKVTFVNACLRQLHPNRRRQRRGRWAVGGR